MSRSVFIGVAVAVLVLMLAGGLRLTEDVPNDERAGAHKRGAATVADDRAESRASVASDGIQEQARRPRGGSIPIVPGRRGASRERGAGTSRDASVRGDVPVHSERNGGAGIADRGAAGLVVDDSGFRAAAERLAERSPAAPMADDDEGGSADLLAHEPPATPVVDDSMTYNSGDYRFSLDSPFQIPNSSDAGTVALWLQPEWSPDNMDDAALMELGQGLFRIYKSGDTLRFEVAADAPGQGASASIAEWQPGEWHSLSATWQNQEVIFYIDGQPVGAPILGNFAVEGQVPVTIGALPSPNQAVAPGTVSDVSLRARPLPPDEIARLFDRSALRKRSP